MKFRHYCGVFLIAALLFLNMTPPMRQLREMPDAIYKQEAAEFAKGLNRYFKILDEYASPVAFSGDETLEDKSVSKEVVFSLFDIPLKTVKVFQTDDPVVTPGGHSIGVSLYTSGVLIVGMSDILTNNGEKLCPGSVAGLQAGDYIVTMKGNPIHQASDMMNACADGSPVELEFIRGQVRYKTTITPVQDVRDGEYRLGLWVRNSTKGVGTLSFANERNGWYAALGHAIIDIDTGTLLTVRSGQTVGSSVVDVVKGEKGVPGELRGSFGPGSKIYGDIRKNNYYGIYGVTRTDIENSLYPDGIAIAYPSEAKTGSAKILTTIDSTGIRAFDCEIIRVNAQTQPATKGMVIKITDPELLRLTGGIVQGMSGSPLIQNDKLIGVVTHVFINDPTKGYCIYALWMFDEAG